MTIQEFINIQKSLGLTIDCIWVKNANGNYVTANGSTIFKNVETIKSNNIVDIIFTI